MKKLIGQMVNIGFGVIISMVLTILTTPIITRIINPESYGEFSLFQTFSNVAMMIFCLGMDQSLVRYYYENDSIAYKRELLKKSTLLPLIIVIIFLFLSFIFAGFFNTYFLNDKIYTFLLLLNITFSIMYRFSIMVVRLEHQSRAYSVLTILSKVVYLINVFIFIFLNITSSYALTISLTISTIFCLIISITINRKIFKFWKSSTNNINLNELMKYGFPYIFSMALTSLFQANDKFFLSIYSDTRTIGIFASAVSIVSFLNIIQNTFTTIWSPYYLDFYFKNPYDHDFFKKVNDSVVTVMIIIGSSLIFFKDYIVFLLGMNYRDAKVLIPFLIFGPIMYTISETTVIGLVIAKRSKLQVIISFITFIIALLLNQIMVPTMGGIGAAISTGISYIIFYILRSYFSNSVLKIDFNFGKSSVLILILFIYSMFSTFYSNQIISFFIYIFIVLIDLTLYRKIISYGLKEIFIKRR
ncbi:lipopolysaccharide biosynthesis protein [Facklamia sp. P9177]|uniref:lipopolysaccharide biosynthesis protein n=1 Tax=Facklamia sp. P9177 TaxID=3421945 RepID=UPI003D1843A7